MAVLDISIGEYIINAVAVYADTIAWNQWFLTDLASMIAIIAELTETNWAVKVWIIACVENLFANSRLIGASREVDTKGVLLVFSAVAMFAWDMDSRGDVDAVAKIIVLSDWDGFSTIGIVFWVV